MHDLIQFHRIHGSSIVLSDSGSVASRKQAELGHGIVFSAKPLKLGQKACLEVTAASQWSGALRIGITSHDPAKTTAAALPRFVCPDLTNRDGYWARAIREDYAETGNRITFYVNTAGQMHYFVNNEHKGLLLNCLPTTCNIWVLVDVYGNTVTAKFVPPAEAPVEIVARGSWALRAYHTACESGTKAVFRTRLMLLGQDGGGKTSLKNALTGQRHNRQEVSTDGIDLSASCSFNLRNRAAWRLAVQGGAGAGAGAGDRDTDVSGQLSAASLEEEYHQALADNIVQQLLHQQKKRAESLSSKASSVSVASSVASASAASSAASSRRANMAAAAATTAPRDNKTGPLSAWDNVSLESLQLSDWHTDSLSDIGKRKELLKPDAPKPEKTPSPSPAPAPGSAPSRGSEGSGGGGPEEEWHGGLLQEMPDRVVSLVQEMMEGRGGGGGGGGASRRPRSASAAPHDSGRNIVLNIWDFAGQAMYYTTHQVFLSSRAVYVIVFDLQQDLYAQSCNAEGYSELTNLGYMDFWMHSIHAHASQNTRESVDNVTLSPPIFLVGTHRASLAPDTQTQHEKAAEKFSQIEMFISGKPYEHHVVPTFYAVENDMAAAMGDEEIVKLRRHIEEVASRESYMGEQMPIKWLRFEKAIQELVEAGTHFSSLEQMREVAGEHGVTTEEELSTVLAFYHDLGVLVHFAGAGLYADPQGLANTPVLRPQWLVDVFRRIINAPEHRSNQQYGEAWSRLDGSGILDDSLLDHVWGDVLRQKPVLLRLMEKFDLLCSRRPNNMSGANRASYFVPSCLKPTSTPSPPHQNPSSSASVTFYFNFAGFLPDGVYQRVVCHAIRWSQDAGGHEPRLAYRSATFFLDPQHDFSLTMEPLSLARIKVTVTRMVNLEGGDGSSSDEDLIMQPMPPPTPTACAKVRNFVESSLAELRALWMKRLSYETCVQCHCEQPCGLHNQTRCAQPQCLHFLNLDECIANKIVCCGHRRVRTTVYRKWFPAPALISKVGPIFSDSLILNVEDTLGNIEATKGPDLPSWVKGAAKLLNGGCIDDQDWITLARKLGYKKNKLDRFNDDLNPALALIADWIVSSGNTSLSVDMLVTCLEQMHRDDIVDVIHRGQEGDQDPPQVFISYQWDLQAEVTQLRDRLEKAGFTCWMDIGQMGGGDQLYSRIDEGIRNAKVVVACLSPKYVVSHYCQRELALADLLRRPILPVMLHAVPWPPPGGMALILAHTLYVDMKGVGGHGGCGIHADIEDKHQEIIQRLLCHATPAVPPPAPPPSHAPGAPVPSPRTARTDMDSASLASSSGGSLLGGPGTRAGAGADYGGAVDSDYSGGNRSDQPVNVLSSSQQQQQQQPVEQVHVMKCAVCVIL